MPYPQQFQYYQHQQMLQAHLHQQQQQQQQQYPFAGQQHHLFEVPQPPQQQNVAQQKTKQIADAPPSSGAEQFTDVLDTASSLKFHNMTNFESKKTYKRSSGAAGRKAKEEPSASSSSASESNGHTTVITEADGLGSTSSSADASILLYANENQGGEFQETDEVVIEEGDEATPKKSHHKRKTGELYYCMATENCTRVL